MISIEEMTSEQKIVWNKINDMMDVSYGCAEAFVTAVGEYLWGEVDDSIKMISTGFSGGVGGSHEELCGGVSGAAIILGLLYGRTVDDEALMIRCKRLISDHRDRFIEMFGTTVCQELRDAQFGADEKNPCSAMIAPAAFMLLEILEEEAQREAQAKIKEALSEEVHVLPPEEYFTVHEDDDAQSLLSELESVELPHEYRHWIGKRLEDIGDSRSGVGVQKDGLPDIHWLEVPGGKVEIERAGTFEVLPFFIAKYPVTFQQYQVFMDDSDGYSNKSWWHGLNVKEDHIKTPGDQQFKQNNNPRENVSWYDAVAFCRWLTDKVKKSEPNEKAQEQICDLIQNGAWEIRLPTEWEWQMAASGGNPENKFPWGLDWDERLAHTKHNQINQTIAVGMYPAGISQIGALDMSGNVWEWCLNCYDDPSNIELGREDRRVLRGGSWYHWGSYAHTDMRSRYYPDYRYNAGGFRVACGKVISK